MNADSYRMLPRLPVMKCFARFGELPGGGAVLVSGRLRQTTVERVQPVA